MNRYMTLCVLVLTGLALVIAPARAQKSNEAEAALEAARQKEILSGDLNAAIKQYSAIAEKYGKTNRAVAAMALIRMAQAYGRQGDVESRRVYDRVLQQYADQQDAVALAHTGLGEGQSKGPVSKTAWTNSNPAFPPSI